MPGSDIRCQSLGPSWLPSMVPSSPVNRMNLPATCGGCHARAYTAFRESWHYQMQRDGDDRGPSCSTCHDQVLGYRLSPREFGSACAACHGAGQVASRSGWPEEARLLLQWIRDARHDLDDARTLIRKTVGKSRRAKLEEAAARAELPLTEAIRHMHRFIFEAAQNRLDLARYRIALLVESLTTVTAP